MHQEFSSRSFLLLLGSVCLLSCSPSDPVDTSIEGEVGPDGRTLTSKDGLLTLIVPAGALDATTSISIQPEEDVFPELGEDAVGRSFRFEPKGLTFEEDVVLEYILPAPEDADKDDLFADAVSELALAWLTGDKGVEFPDQEVEVDLGFGETRLRVNLGGTFDFSFMRIYEEGFDPDFGRFQIGYAYADEAFEGEAFETRLDVELTNLGRPWQWMLWQGLGDSFWSDQGEQEDLGNLEGMPGLGDTTLYEHDVTLTPLDQGILDYFFLIEFLLTLDPLAALFLPPGWVDPPPTIAFRVGFDDIVIESTECVPPECEPGGGGEDVVVINSDLTNLENIRAAYTEVSDPSPFPTTGQLTDPWLYVTGSEGTSYYRINREDDGRVIEGAIISTISGFGELGGVPMATGQDPDRAHSLVMYGPSGAWRTNWNDQTLEYGAIVLAVAGAVTDVARYQSVSSALGAAVAVNSSSQVLFIEYDPTSRFYIVNPQRSIFSGVFEDRTGDVVSAYASSTTSGVVVVMDGSPGQIWAHDLAQTSEPASLQGTAGNDPRQIRGAGDVLAISNFGSDSITVASWNQLASVTIDGSYPVGDGPIGIDVLQRSNGTYVILSTGSNDDSYTLTELTTAGAFTSQATEPVPTQCNTPKHAVFLRGPIVYLAFSCFSSGNIVLLETDLEL